MEPVRDVLVGGPERDPGGRWLAGRPGAPVRGTAAALALLAGAALLAQRGPSDGDAGPTVDPVRVVLHPTALVVLRHAPPAPGRAAIAEVHVELINTGERALVLTAAALVPGRWEVEVEDRPRLQPGWSAVLDLHREVDCAPGADHGPVPSELVLEVDVDGRGLVRTIDVGPGQVAYGGGLDDVLGSPQDACV